MTAGTTMRRRLMALGGLVAAAFILIVGAPMAGAQPAPRAGTLTVHVVPQLAGVELRVDGVSAFTDTNGDAHLPIQDFAGVEKRLEVVPTQIGPDLRVTLDRVIGTAGPRRGALTVGVKTQRLVTYGFLGPDETTVDPARVDRFVLRGSTGETVAVERPHVGEQLWLPASRTQQTPLGRLVSKDSYWTVSEVMLEGTQVVNKGQQKFVPNELRDWTIRLLFYQVKVSGQDAIFGTPAGRAVELYAPDGTVQVFPFRDGTAQLVNVPRGDYRLRVVASGLSFVRPVGISKDQELILEVITPLDITLAGTVILGAAVGLVAVGRRARLVPLVHQVRGWKPRVRWMPAKVRELGSAVSALAFIAQNGRYGTYLRRGERIAATRSPTRVGSGPTSSRSGPPMSPRAAGRLLRGCSTTTTRWRASPLRSRCGCCRCRGWSVSTDRPRPARKLVALLLLVAVVGVAPQAEVEAAVLPNAVQPPTNTQTTPAAADVPLMAYYYIWYNQFSWRRAKRDFPLLGNYSSADPSVMRDHIDMASAAGLKGFLVSWKHTDVLDPRLEQLVELARETQFKLGIVYQGLDFERNPLPAVQIAEDLRYFAHVYGSDPVFDVFGRPVVIITGSDRYTTDELRQIVDPVRSRLKVLASAKTVEDYERVAGVLEGNAYYWSSADPTDRGFAKKLNGMGAAVRAHGGLWLAPAPAGFDATALDGHRVVPQREGKTLRSGIEAAMQSSPDAVAVISWNEFSENSHIEPSVQNGTAAIEELARVTQSDINLARFTFDSSEPAPGASGIPGWAALVVSVLLIAGLGIVVRGGGGSSAPAGRHRRYAVLEGLSDRSSVKGPTS